MSGPSRFIHAGTNQSSSTRRASGRGIRVRRAQIESDRERTVGKGRQCRFCRMGLRDQRALRAPRAHEFCALSPRSAASLAAAFIIAGSKARRTSSAGLMALRRREGLGRRRAVRRSDCDEDDADEGCDDAAARPKTDMPMPGARLRRRRPAVDHVTSATALRPTDRCHARDHRIWTALRQVTQKKCNPHLTSGNASSPAFSRQIGAGSASDARSR